MINKLQNLAKTFYNSHLNFNQIIILVIVMSFGFYTTVPAKVVTVPVEVEKVQVVKVPTYVNQHDREQINCLAQNIYFEAGNQSKQGMIAVTNVVMNRVRDSRFPKTPCNVVFQRYRGSCQFSWVCEKKTIRDRKLFENSKKVAEDVYLGNVRDVTKGALFYHATYINPGWNRRSTVVIGDHIFYR